MLKILLLLCLLLSFQLNVYADSDKHHDEDKKIVQHDAKEKDSIFEEFGEGTGKMILVFAGLAALRFPAKAILRSKLVPSDGFLTALLRQFMRFHSLFALLALLAAFLHGWLLWAPVLDSRRLLGAYAVGFLATTVCSGLLLTRRIKFRSCFYGFHLFLISIAAAAALLHAKSKWFSGFF